MAFDLHSILTNAATIDELLGLGYQPQVGQKESTDRAALRLAAWCRSASSGDWSLFVKRLDRDKFSIERVLPRFAEVKYSSEAPQPQWFVDAQWTYQALTGELGNGVLFSVEGTEPQPFEKLFYALVEAAETNVISQTTPQALALLKTSARANLRCRLLKLLTDLYAPLLYSKFVAILKKYTPDDKLPPSTGTEGTEHFDQFLEELRATLLAAIFTEKPVLLRLTATIVRQWIDTTTELITRLHADLPRIRAAITHSAPSVNVHTISGGLSDPHNFGHAVQIITFDDHTKLVYKPKDLRVDEAWHDLIVRFNASSPPVQLKPVKTIASHEYGWT